MYPGPRSVCYGKRKGSSPSGKEILDALAEAKLALVVCNGRLGIAEGNSRALIDMAVSLGEIQRCTSAVVIPATTVAEADGIVDAAATSARGNRPNQHEMLQFEQSLEYWRKG